MANLTMLIIVVSLSGLLFIWATSSFGAYAGGAGDWFTSRSIANHERVSLEAVESASTCPSNNIVNLYVAKVGTAPLTVASVYEKSARSQIPQSPRPVNT